MKAKTWGPYRLTADGWYVLMTRKEWKREQKRRAAK